jgi:5'-nucleotidase
MKLLIARPFRLVAASLLLGACIAAPAAEPVRLRLIGFNDFHGNLEPGNLSLMLADPASPDKPMRVPAGGAAALAGLVKALRAEAPHSLLLSSGDLIGGSPLVSALFRQEPTIEVMNRIGLQANAVGNHEFDAGLAELQRMAQGGCKDNAPKGATRACTLKPFSGAEFPMLAANVLAAGGKPVFAPYVIKRYGGIRVGLIGAVTRSTPRIVVPSGVTGLRFTDEADAVNRAARELKERGVNAIIASFHEGGEVGSGGHRADWNDESCPNARGPIFRIAEKLSPDIDVIFSGHTHQGYRCIVDGRVIIQGTSYGRGLSVVDVELDPKTRDVIPARTRSINLPVLNERANAELREHVASTTPAPYGELLRKARPDEALAKLVAGYSEAVAPKARQPVGRITASFTRDGHTDSAAGRLIADAQLAATRAPDKGGAQIALMNRGGIRTDLDCRGKPPCTVTYGQLFSMQPFGNSLVVMTLTGQQLKDLLELQRRYSGEPHFLQPSKGLSYAWKASAPRGEHVLDLKLDGELVQPDRNYRVTVNSFLAEGGDGFTVLREGTDRLGGAQDLDATLAWLGRGAPKAPDTRPRIEWVP